MVAKKETTAKKTTKKAADKKTAVKKADKVAKVVVEKKVSKVAKKSLEDLKTVEKAVEAPVQEEVLVEVKKEEAPAKREPKKDKFGRSQATGKKKDAIARVFIKLGKGKLLSTTEISRTTSLAPCCK